jgi:hypothetical protein
MIDESNQKKNAPLIFTLPIVIGGLGLILLVFQNINPNYGIIGIGLACLGGLILIPIMFYLYFGKPHIRCPKCNAYIYLEKGQQKVICYRCKTAITI